MISNPKTSAPMTSTDLVTQLKTAREDLRFKLKYGGGDVLNQIFPITAQQFNCPDNCRRRHCRNDRLCYAKHPAGTDCSAEGPSDFFEQMAGNFAALLAMYDLQHGGPQEIDRQALVYLIAFAAKDMRKSVSVQKTERKRTANPRQRDLTTE
jgi:hypothetical protein